MTIQVTSVRVVMNRAAVDYFRGWNGPVGRAISRLAMTIKTLQQVLVAKKTGMLASSIKVGPKSRWAGGITVTIGAGSGGGGLGGGRGGYALANELGARPHIIRPRKPGGMLIFYWAKVGRVVHLLQVSHPGNRPYLWATRSLAAAMRRF